MSFKCICGSKRFVANQMIRAEIIVNEDGEFIENCPGGIESNIYDAGEPYGPFICERCGKEYETLEAGSEKPEIIQAECIEGYHWFNFPDERLSYLLPEDGPAEIALAAKSNFGSSETVLTAFRMNEENGCKSSYILSCFSIQNRIQRRIVESALALFNKGMVDAKRFASIIDSISIIFAEFNRHNNGVR